MGIRVSATFTTKREAQAWAAQEETRLRDDTSGKVSSKPCSGKSICCRRPIVSFYNYVTSKIMTRRKSPKC